MPGAAGAELDLLGAVGWGRDPKRAEHSTGAPPTRSCPPARARPAGTRECCSAAPHRCDPRTRRTASAGLRGGLGGSSPAGAARTAHGPAPAPGRWLASRPAGRGHRCWVPPPPRTEGSGAPPPSANLVPQLRVPPILQQQLQAPAAPPGRSDVQRREPLGSPTTVPASPLSPRRLRSPLGSTGPSPPRPLPGIGVPSVAQQQPQAAHSSLGPPRSTQMDGGEPSREQQVGVGPALQEDLHRPAGGGGTDNAGVTPHRSTATAVRQCNNPGCKAYAAAATPGLLQRPTLPRATPDPSPPPPPPRSPSRCPLTPRARPAALHTAAPPPRAAPRHSCRRAHAPPHFESPARRR